MYDAQLLILVFSLNFFGFFSLSLPLVQAAWQSMRLVNHFIESQNSTCTLRDQTRGLVAEVLLPCNFKAKLLTWVVRNSKASRANSLNFSRQVSLVAPLCSFAKASLSLSPPKRTTEREHNSFRCQVAFLASDINQASRWRFAWSDPFSFPVALRTLPTSTFPMHSLQDGRCVPPS